MLIGYARVSKADGSQSLDLQRDALLAEGVDPGQIYEDCASGAKDDRTCGVRIPIQRTIVVAFQFAPHSSSPRSSSA